MLRGGNRWMVFVRLQGVQLLGNSWRFPSFLENGGNAVPGVVWSGEALCRGSQRQLHVQRAILAGEIEKQNSVYHKNAVKAVVLP